MLWSHCNTLVMIATFCLNTCRPCDEEISFETFWNHVLTHSCLKVPPTWLQETMTQLSSVDGHCIFKTTSELNWPFCVCDVSRVDECQDFLIKQFCGSQLQLGRILPLSYRGLKWILIQFHCLASATLDKSRKDSVVKYNSFFFVKIY